MTETLVVDDLIFALRRSPRRTTVGITVGRDGELVVHVPLDCPPETIERIAAEKRAWVYAKLAQKELFRPTVQSREFVTGEGFSYLGRSYRLALIDASPLPQVPALRLHQGRFLLRRDERPRAHDHFVAWYVAHGRPWLERRVTLTQDRIGVEPQGVAVRDLGHRWGSCGENGILNFHWRTVLQPPRIVEYVVAHELVHLHEPHHGPAFWRRLERAMPDFAARKRWLAENPILF